MDISTSYLGFELPSPFIAGAGPLADTPQHAKQIEDAGTSAIVISSLFEEKVNAEERAVVDQYLEHIRKLKETVDIPVFASLNAHTSGPWLDVVTEFVAAGADALELNIYNATIDIDESAASVEQRAVEMVKEIKKSIKIPLAVKMSAFYTSLGHFAFQLENAGADGLVLFNRFFEADIDISSIGKPKVTVNRRLSTSRELYLRLRWLSVLSASLKSATLAVSGGVHSGSDAVRAIICGASVVQMVSALLENGPGHLSTVQGELFKWMEQREYESLEEIRGSVDISRSRTDYRRLLQRWEWIWGARP